MQAHFIHLCFLAEISKQPKNQRSGLCCVKLSISSVLCYCTIPFGLHVYWDVVYILLLGGRRCKTEDLLFLWGIGRTAANIFWTHHCKPSSLSKCCSVEQLSSLCCSCTGPGNMRQNEGVPQTWYGLVDLPSRGHATALTSLAGWGRGAVFLSRECPDGCSSSSAVFLSMELDGLFPTVRRKIKVSVQ